MKSTMFFKLIFFISVLFGFGFVAISQRYSSVMAYEHHTVEVDGDTIFYHNYTNGNPDSCRHVLLYLQGSQADPLYRIQKRDDQISIRSTIPFNLKDIPADYLFVVVSKKGIPFSIDETAEWKVPSVYFEHQTLNYRTFQADQVIQDLLRKKSFEKIVALGHSEGSDVVAKLGTINDHVTHFGYWSGGGYTQFLDFITRIRQRVDQGIISELEAQIEIDSVFNNLRTIMNEPEAADQFWNGSENSFKRWNHFSEPPIDNLLQISEPIFVAIGSRDQSVPVESAYLIPVEFIRHQKTNLQFTVYPDLDHQFRKKLEDGSYERHWDEVFQDFLTWVES